MKICVTATAFSLDAQIFPQFGGCSCFILADFETMRFEAIPNMAAGVSGGVGIQATQTIANTDVNLFITGKVWPKAFQALSAEGIDIVTESFGTVREVIEKFKRGEPKKTGVPNVGDHFGMGGRGGGRGVWKP